MRGHFCPHKVALCKQHAVYGGAAQRLKGRGGGVPLNQWRIGFLCQNGALDIRIIVTVKTQQVQRAL